MSILAKMGDWQVRRPSCPVPGRGGGYCYFGTGGRAGAGKVTGCEGAGANAIPGLASFAAPRAGSCPRPQQVESGGLGPGGARAAPPPPGVSRPGAELPGSVGRRRAEWAGEGRRVPARPPSLCPGLAAPVPPEEPWGCPRSAPGPHAGPAPSGVAWGPPRFGNGQRGSWGDGD